MTLSKCLTIHFNRMTYNQAWNLQRRLHKGVAKESLPDLLLLLEHPHVFTLGRRGEIKDILANAGQLAELEVEIHHTDRGGEVTYHGPGQLIGYPIINLRTWKGGPLQYVRRLEEMIISTLKEFGISGVRGNKPTGVWVNESKISAIGVKISQGATLHGFALNVDPDLSYFEHIVPCGMPGSTVTSMTREVSQKIDVREVIPVLTQIFGKAFRLDMEWETREWAENQSRLLNGSHRCDEL